MHLNSSPKVSVESSVTPVRIHYKVRLMDTEGQILVDRHVPAKELFEHPRIHELYKAFGGQVVVSPDGSPNRSVASGDEVRVETDSGNLFDAWEKKIEEKFEKIFEKSYNHILQMGNAAALRLLEDWVILRMKTSARIPAEMSHRETVTTFLRNYNATCPRRYLESLRNSEERHVANYMIHGDPRDEAKAEALWNSLRECLSDEDKRKYQALYEFGTYRSQIQYKKGK